MQAWLARGPGPVLALAAAALAAYGLFVASPYGLRLLTIAGVYALMVLGYQFIFGHAGALSLVQGAFFGLGAYVTGILGSRYGWSFPATFPLSLLAPAALAAVIAAPVLRLETHYFALATLAVSQGVLLLAVNWESVTGGANGLPGVPGVELFGLALGRGWPLAAFVWGWVALAGLAAWSAMRGLYGQGFLLMREAPLAAGTLGLDVGRMRVSMLVLSALYAGGAGALYVHTLGVISPEAASFPIMVACLTMAVVGGSARVAGAILGALLLVHLPEWMRGLERTYLIAYGAALLAAIVFVPDGLIGAAERLWRRAWPPTGPTVPTAMGSPQRAGRVAAGPALAVRGLEKAYGGVRALAGIDIDLARGEVLGVIGPNGSGKTTFANLVAGLDRPDRGRVALGGRDVTGLASHRIARLGMARSFQTPQLVPAMTVLDAVAVARAEAEGAGLLQALAAPGADPALARARGRAMAVIERVGLAAQALTPCGDLPHGDRRRVDVARALAAQPSVLILDEPAAGLARGGAERLARLLRDLADEGLGVIVIDHVMGFVLPLADRAICLDAGRIIAEGSPDAVARHEAVVEAYLGAPGEAAAP